MMNDLEISTAEMACRNRSVFGRGKGGDDSEKHG